MSIISDIFDAFSEVKKTLGTMQKTPDKIMGAGNAASGENRFFDRPINSVARRAKQSVLYYPVVGSESLSAETLTIIAKAIQVRAAEYTRLLVSNMDAVEAASQGKTAVISALRGATLKDAFVKHEDIDAASELVRTRASMLVEHAFVEDGLRAPLTEGIGSVGPNATNPVSPGGPKRSKSGGNGGGIWSTFTDPQKIATIARMWNSGNPIAKAEARRAAEGMLRNPTTSGVDADLRAAGAGGILDDINDEAARRDPHRVHFKSAPQANDVFEAMDAAVEFLNAGTAVGRARAKQIVDEIMQTYGGSGVMDELELAGLGGLAMDVEAGQIRKNEEERRRLNPEIEEAERRTKALSSAREMANRKTPAARQQAVQMISDLMSTGDVVALEKDAECSKIINMLKALPAGVIRDGSYDISGSSNRVATMQAIDFEKLNAFQPVLLDLSIRYKTPAGEPLPITDRIVLAVKGVAHPIPSMDIVTGLGTALQRDSLVLQFFRMTSGETSFVKDFVLNLKVAKMRASGKTTSGAKVLETLRRQSEWNERRENWLVSAISKRGFVPPTTTMVVTADEVDKIKSLYGVDFTKGSAVRDLMKSHNLMGFVIVDEAIGLVRMFEDGDDDFDRIPITTLKSQGKEASVKDIMTILAKS